MTKGEYTTTGDQAELAKAFNRALKWFKLKDVEGLPERFGASFASWQSTSPEREYSADAIAALDARLLEVLRHTLNNATHVEGHVLKSSLRFWVAPSLIVVDPAACGANPHGVMQHIERITDFVKVDAQGTSYSVRYRNFAVGKTASGLEYACHFHINTMVMSAQWLDQHYPKWRKLSDLCDTLGMDEQYLINSIFYPQDLPGDHPQLPCVNLPAVN